MDAYDFIGKDLRQRALSVELSAEEIMRYSRQIMLGEVSLEGQKRLKAARVLVIGIGGLGSPVSLYLAAAGIGTLGICDSDTIDHSNLHRQILYKDLDVGSSKVRVAGKKLQALNPYANILEHALRVDESSVVDLISQYDVIIDGTDNLVTRYLIADACVLAQKPLIYGAVFRFGGQASVFYSPWGPCYRCLYPFPPANDKTPTCSESGILGVVPGQIGTIQATEVLKLILGIGSPLIGRVLTVDGRSAQYSEYLLARDPACPSCGSGAKEEKFSPIGRGCLPGEMDVVDTDEKTITAVELLALLSHRHPIRIFDIRSSEETYLGVIPGAELVEPHFILEKLLAVPSEVKCVVYCASGQRSTEVLRVSRQAGCHNVFSLKGGIFAWLSHHSTMSPS